jgi:hypothetical protein
VPERCIANAAALAAIAAARVAEWALAD